jgi:predicted metallo-beta-lactamase superfamily hydrolase
LKILVKPLCAESLGVRSISTYVETPDIKVLIDAGASLGPRNGLLPHTLEYKALGEAKKKIAYYAAKSDVIVISHYHYDHFSPFFSTLDTKWTWCDKKVAEEVYSNKIVYIKDFNSSIIIVRKEGDGSSRNYSKMLLKWFTKQMAGASTME